MDENKLVTTNEMANMISSIDMKAFLAEEEAKLANDLALVAQRKSELKQKKIMKVLTIVAVCLTTILSAAYAKGSEYTREKGRKYQAALELQERGMYEDAIEVYDGLYGYENSDSNMDYCQEMMYQAKQKNTYDTAVEMYDEKDFLSAAILFSRVSGYEDAQAKASECYYKFGEICVEKGEYENAHNAFLEAQGYKDADELAAKYEFAVVEAGEELIFGKYEQDGNVANGAEDLEWYVLYKEGNQALLVSKYVLALEPFNSPDKAKPSDQVSEQKPAETTEETPAETTEPTKEAPEVLTYANSTLRAFVNEEFYNAAFTDEEKALLETISISEKDLAGKELAVSENKVFLLDTGTVEEYLTKKSMKVAYLTDAARVSSRYTKSAWWTSSVNRSGNTKVCTVATSGTIALTNATGYCGVRPAIWVNFVK